MAGRKEGYRNKLINLNEENWQLLGDKVGSQGRTAWINKMMEEEVRIPDKKKELLFEMEKQQKIMDSMNNKLDVINKDEEETRKHYDETKSNMENAITEASNFIDEELEDDDYRTIKQSGIYGLDKNREIADTFNVNADELLAELEDIKEFKTYKIAVLKFKDSGKTATEYNK